MDRIKSIEIKPGFLMWKINVDGKPAGYLRLPVLAQFLFNSGAAQLFLSDGKYALSYPKRMADILGEKEYPVRLTQGKTLVVEINRKLILGVPQYDFSWKDGRFKVDKHGDGWVVANQAGVFFEIHKKGGLAPRYEVNLSGDEAPLELIVAVVWTTVCPLERV